MAQTRSGAIAPTGCAVAALGLAAFGLSVAAEFTKAKEGDLKADGALCYLPATAAAGLGTAALACVFAAQVIGNAAACGGLICSGKENRSRRDEDSRNPRTVLALLAVSWVGFGATSVLLGAATSMNEEQPYGRGWVEGECYWVRDGMFVAAAALALLTVAAALASLNVAVAGKLKCYPLPANFVLN